MRWLSRLGVPYVFGITLGLGLGVLSQTGSGEPAFNPAHVQCYAAAAAPAQPAASPYEDDVQQRDALESLHGALEAARQCTLGRCGKAAGRALDVALTGYLDKRAALTARHYREQGAAGLARSARIFATPEQTELSRRLGQLHAAGGLDMARYAHRKEALALTVLKEPESFRPCEAFLSRTSVRGYVY